MAFLSSHHMQAWTIRKVISFFFFGWGGGGFKGISFALNLYDFSVQVLI